MIPLPLLSVRIAGSRPRSKLYSPHVSSLDSGKIARIGVAPGSIQSR